MGKKMSESDIGKNAYLEPHAVPEGEWVDVPENPIDEIFANPVRNQYGFETYWKISFTNNIWITPGVHLVLDPSLNLEDDFITIPQIKLRVAI